MVVQADGSKQRCTLEHESVDALHAAAWQNVRSSPNQKRAAHQRQAWSHRGTRQHASQSRHALERRPPAWDMGNGVVLLASNLITLWPQADGSTNTMAAVCSEQQKKNN